MKSGSAGSELDRSALPDPGTHACGEYAESQGEIEKALAGIWQEVLGAERVGRDDNFFELNGNSILAIRLVVKVDECFGTRLPVRTFFRNPTVRLMAQAVSELLSENGGTAASRSMAFEEGSI